MAQQSVAFGCSVLMGIGLGVIYGLLKLWRTAFCPGRLAVVLSDSCFMLLWALAIFCFSLAYLSGYVRFYVAAGSLSGIVLYRLTIGRVLFRIYSPIIRITKKAIQKICEKIKIFAKYLLKIACKLLYNIGSGFKWLKRKKSKIQLFSEIRNCNDKKRFTKKQSAQKKQPKRADIRNTDKSSRQNCGSRRKGRRPQGH